MSSSSIIGFDGHASQTLSLSTSSALPKSPSGLLDAYQIVKRLPRAMSASNDEWIDYLEVRGCDAWFEENGDVMMGSVAHPDDVVEMGGLMTSWIGAVGCSRWRYGGER